jgi:tetratricopeptide (TPR) repeat protein
LEEQLPNELWDACSGRFGECMTGVNSGSRRGSNHSGLALAWLFFVLLSPFSTGAQENSPTFDDLILRASAAREQNNIRQAIELYSQAVNLNPKWPDGWWFLGSLQYGADAYAAARDALTRYLELTPNAGPALALRGLCEFETTEYPQSLKDIQQALSLGAANQPRNEKILRYHEALLLTRTGKFEEALQRYGLLAKNAPANPELLAAIGLAGLRTPLLPKEIAANQMDLFVAAGNGTFQFMSGDKVKAKQAFQDFFKRFPKEPNAHYLYGYLLFPTDPDEAVTEFKREVEVSPTNPFAQAVLAWDSLFRNNPSEALQYAQKAAATAPELPVAQLVLGRSLVETGNIEDGTKHLEKALQLEPGNIEIHLALVKAYSESGRKVDARRERLLCLQITQEETAQSALP